ncbi:hypothetical protein Tco_0709664 [Tanacetum coccineum]
MAGWRWMYVCVAGMVSSLRHSSDGGWRKACRWWRWVEAAVAVSSCGGAVGKDDRWLTLSVQRVVLSSSDSFDR